MQRKRNNILAAALLSLPLLLAACGSHKTMLIDSADKTAAASSSSRGAQQSESVRKLTFVQRVSDNQVYAKNITGSMTLRLQAAGKDISLPGALKMRKDQVIRLQLFIPILGTEVGRLEFTPDYVLIIDRMHKEYIKADYSQVDFLERQGLSFYSLQALFWNQLLLPGTKKVTESDLKKFDADLDAASATTVPVTYSRDNMHYTWTADRTTGRISQTTVDYKSQSHGSSTVTMHYADFRSVGVKQFPASLRLSLATTATKTRQEATLSIDMDEVKTDDSWEAQTEVSGKYKKVEAADVLRKIMSL